MSDTTTTRNQTPTAADAGTLVITAKGQCVSLERVDGDVAFVKYPNGRRGTLPTESLWLVEL